MERDELEYAIRIQNHRDELNDQEVAEWLDAPEHRELLDHLALIKQGLECRQFEDRKSEEWARVRKKITLARIRRASWRWAVAAAVVLLLGAGGWFWLRVRDVPEMLPVWAENGIQPGGMRAELVLSGGECVPLGNKSLAIHDKEVKGIVNDSSGMLNYAQVTQPEGATVYNTLRVPVGGFYRIELPDGSRVWLNAASELRFPVAFTGAKREVYLKGEGYFEVSRDSARQFVVHLPQAEVTVLGTVFNINAYEEEKHLYTTLVEGAVVFYSRQRQERVVLQPGMQSDMNLETGETVLAKVEPTIYTAWTQGRFIFQSMTLETMMRQLQRWYDFDVFYQAQDIKGYRFRGVIDRDRGIQEVLDIIEETTDVQFNINDRMITVQKK